jgi:hypothetical protein
MRAALEIQMEANRVDKEMAKIAVDLAKWRTRKSELELEAIEFQQAQFESQIKAQQPQVQAIQPVQK